MKPKTWMALAVILAVWVPTFPAAAQDKVVARVDGEPIHEAEMQRALGSLAARNGMTLAQLQAHPQYPAMQKRALADLIDRSLLYGRAQREIQVPEQAVDQAVARLAGQFPDEQTFQRQIQAMGYTVDGLRRDMRRELTVQQWLSSEAFGEAKVKEQDVQAYFEENRALFRSPDLVRLQHILVPADDQQTAELVKQGLQAGTAFDQLARRHSIDHGAMPGGELGFVNAENLGSRLAAVVNDLQTGDVSTAVTDDDGVHWFRLEERRQGVAVGLEQVREDIERHLQTGLRAERLRSLLQELQGAADIDILMELPR